ncbi:amidase domain-containing protein [Cohnella zeiphila]|uniref:Amidase domain-containing protein n=1 Tax=Cohnella zeiphila TaxID=2761120 RepID=A0A7X0SM00_9BACL|nr:amidase domain-containing protein [Cohnella zeiphila]MBB6731279.1 amidase domain-containing protein [Cohnella zeiphila]
MPGQGSGWREALVEYVNARNEEDLLGPSASYRRVPDPLHRSRLLGRQAGLSRRGGASRVKPVRSEIRARLLHRSEKPSEAVCDVRLHLLHSYGAWQEERMETERIAFVRGSRGWRIDRIEPLLTENRAEAWQPEGDAEELVGYEHAVIPSVPYLNPAATQSFKSRVYAGPGAAAGRGDGWFDPSKRAARYRREEAAAYADRWWDRPNPEYEEFEVNCTNFVSQCIFAGGAPMNYTGRREAGWWYRGRDKGRELWSYSWAVANGLQSYFSHSYSHSYGLRAEAMESPKDLMPGDVICYDWSGTGLYQHNTVVTAFTPDGMPLVNANTVPSRHRYWDYRDSYAWTEQTRYRFYHIADEF